MSSHITNICKIINDSSLIDIVENKTNNPIIIFFNSSAFKNNDIIKQYAVNMSKQLTGCFYVYVDMSEFTHVNCTYVPAINKTTMTKIIFNKSQLLLLECNNLHYITTNIYCVIDSLIKSNKINTCHTDHARHTSQNNQPSKHVLINENEKEKHNKPTQHSEKYAEKEKHNKQVQPPEKYAEKKKEIIAEQLKEVNDDITKDIVTIDNSLKLCEMNISDNVIDDVINNNINKQDIHDTPHAEKTPNKPKSRKDTRRGTKKN